jgi:hypothetical protein
MSYIVLTVQGYAVNVTDVARGVHGRTYGLNGVNAVTAMAVGISWSNPLLSSMSRNISLKLRSRCPLSIIRPAMITIEGRITDLRAKGAEPIVASTSDRSAEVSSNGFFSKECLQFMVEKVYPMHRCVQGLIVACFDACCA